MTPFGKTWAAAWRKQYLRHFRIQVRAVLPGEQKEVLRLVKQNAHHLYRARRHEAPDRQGLMVISSSALILASYRELIARGISEDRAFEVVRGSFSSVFAESAGRAVRTMLFFLPDPVTSMRRHSIAPMFRMVFGSMFTFESTRSDDSFLLTISRCGIHDFFVSEGEPQLTRAFCAWDRNWLGELDHSERPVATRRSLTLVTDGRPCEFHFEPSGAGPSPTVDVAL